MNRRKLCLCIAVLLALALSVSLFPGEAFAVVDYGLWLGGVQVTSANCGNIAAAIRAADPGATVTGTAVYDPSQHTLELTDFVYTGGSLLTDGDSIALWADSDFGGLMILVSGACRLANDRADDYYDAYGILFEGESNLYIAGNAVDADSLTVTAARHSDDNGMDESTGIRVSKANLIVDRCKVTASGGDSEDDSSGVTVRQGNLTLQHDARLYCTGGSCMESSSDGLSVPMGTVTVNAGCILSCKSGAPGMSGDSTAIYAKNIYNSGSLDATSARADDNDSYAIRCTGKVTVTNGELTAIAGDGMQSCGIYANELDVAQSSMEVSSSDAIWNLGESVSYGIHASHISITDGSEVRSAGGSDHRESYGIYTEYCTVNGNSYVEALGGEAYELTCGLYSSSDAPVIGEGSEVVLTGGAEEENACGSYGLFIKGDSMSIETDVGGSLLASGRDQAIRSEDGAGGKVTLSAGYIYFTYSYAGYGSLELGDWKGDHMELEIVSSKRYVYARGDSEQRVTLEGTANTRTGAVSCTVISDMEICDAYLVAATYDEEGRLLDLKFKRFARGDYTVQEEYDEVYIDDDEPIFVGTETYDIGVMDLGADWAITIMLVKFDTFAPLCPPAVVTFVN